MDKRTIYAEYGIEYANGKINAPVFGFINPLLVNGNAKLGKGVWTFSTLPGTAEYTANGLTAKGTCACDCTGCYAKTGFYNMPSVIESNLAKTFLAREHTDFIKNAIIAQIKADNIKLVRIHASGDFFSAEYVNAWRDIVTACQNTVFWTYTKNPKAERAFDDLGNINIVKSCIPGIGFNFGHCDYIIDTYNTLKANGETVHICKCGFNKNQHCVNCKGCSENKYVLFVEHSTSYKAEQDDRYSELLAMVNAQ